MFIQSQRCSGIKYFNLIQIIDVDIIAPIHRVEIYQFNAISLYTVRLGSILLRSFVASFGKFSDLSC